MKLTIELVPKGAWTDNLRKVLSTSEWDTVRRKVYQKYNYKCSICGVGKQLHCHEAWEYNLKEHTQKLVDLVALCPMCHHVKHLGYAEVLASEGRLNMEDLVKHFCKVNECGLELFHQHRREAFHLWSVRSDFSWKTVIDGWELLL